MISKSPHSVGGRKKRGVNTVRTGNVFNIERYAIHDGPGIRTVVFLKGCPLRCKWCSNPESQRLQSEIFHSARKCLGGAVCGTCAKVCPHGAVTNHDGMLHMDRSKCVGCGTCVRACPAKAMQLQGTARTADAILAELELDEPFYRRSGGGITVSGGEPLVQAEFTAELLQRARERHMSTCVETTGCAPWEKLALIAPHTNFFLYDVKHMDSEKHRLGTGAGNELILENLLRLSEEFPEANITVRTPVIPGFNDTEEDIGAIARFLAPLSAVRSYALLPFHTYGESKYEALDRVYEVDTEARISEGTLKKLHATADLSRYR